MRKNNKVLLEAEEQLVFGQSREVVSRARDNLKEVVPGCLLLDLLEAKIGRMRNAPHPPEISARGA